MSATTTETVVTPTDGDTDDLCHVICDVCNKALCGAPHDPNEVLRPWALYDDDCLVCDDLDRDAEVCIRCGSP